MSVREKIKEQLRLEREYTRLAENEGIYYDEISLWEKLRKCAIFLFFVSLVLVGIPYFLLPQNIRNRPILELLPEYPLEGSLITASLILFPTSVIAFMLLSDKISKIRDELGLHREEHIYLRAYETRKNIGVLLTESNPKRKLYFKKLTLESVQEMTKDVEGWKYGNVRLVSKLVGNEIDLIKDNMRRLVLSNVARGDDETVLKKISEILIELCKYIHSPSVKRLSELNIMIGKLPFKEYKFLTKKEKIGEYFYGKPRMFRLLFAFIVTTTLIVVLLCLGQNIGVIFAVAVPTFWGAFAGFDKIFRLKEERSK